MPGVHQYHLIAVYSRLPTEIAWHERRRAWIGENRSQRSQRMPREQIMSWTTTYEELLSSTEPFHESIPLAEMVDFLVDIWLEEGLYD
ncbi:unnamed protein product [Ilex paraguariensis]|uniref:Gag1-like clamp domain-containing protein n=1 Tax=Ilex paraguariensis TaxID=185542 RepID=A0ABC8SUS3_9AQUA